MQVWRNKRFAGWMLQYIIEVRIFCCSMDAAIILQGWGCKHFAGWMLQTFYRVDAANIIQGKRCKNFAGLTLQTFCRVDSANIFNAKTTHLILIFIKKVHNLHHFRKLMQIRYQKGAGPNAQMFTWGYILYVYPFKSYLIQNIAERKITPQFWLFDENVIFVLCPLFISLSPWIMNFLKYL